MIQFVLHWLAVHLGIVNESGPYYGFWSGSGSDIGELALLGGVFGLYWHHTCHTDGCYWPGRHPANIAGRDVKLCKRCLRRAGHEVLTRAHLHAHRLNRSAPAVVAAASDIGPGTATVTTSSGETVPVSYAGSSGMSVNAGIGEPSE